jgi:flagellar biosynthesis/type III secretory pathway M-ring protein FliF/YscJ
VNDYYLKKLHILITILAALITTAVCVFNRESLYFMAVLVSLTIVVFYIFGLMVQGFVANRVFPPLPEPEPEEEEEPEEEIEEVEYLPDESNGVDDSEFAAMFADSEEI